LLLATWGEWSLYHAIRKQAAANQARTAGAIVVLGAAEYDGAPSPVYRARLDHAFDLEESGFAPWVITSGGPGGDPHYTEAGVGRDYLIQEGMAKRKILTEAKGGTTYQSVRGVSRILHSLGVRTCIAVSDGFHLYRVKTYFASFGITAYGSPAPASAIEGDAELRTLYSLRELVILDLWYLHIHV